MPQELSAAKDESAELPLSRLHGSSPCHTLPSSLHAGTLSSRWNRGEELGRESSIVFWREALDRDAELTAPPCACPEVDAPCACTSSPS